MLVIPPTCCHGSASTHGNVRLDQIVSELIDTLSNSEPVSCQSRVSLAQVVVMVAQVSPKETLAVFAIEVVGLDVFTILI